MSHPYTVFIILQMCYSLIFHNNRKDSNVALKIVHVDADIHEYQILQHLRDSPIAHANVTHPGRKNVVRLLDDFDLGVSHKCLVLEVMGMNVQSRADEHPGRRLPGSTARGVTYQIALGLDYLWECGVAHGGEHWSPWLVGVILTNKDEPLGDLHGGNILFTALTAPTLSEEEIRRYLGKPVLGAVQRRDGGSLGPSMPRYLVRPATFRGSDREVRIVDLGRGEIKIPIIINPARS